MGTDGAKYKKQRRKYNPLEGSTSFAPYPAAPAYLPPATALTMALVIDWVVEK